ncbi:MAG: hypothetical protein A2135_02765 [Actinobacteria bacterium RBG_16_67_15]|nr:MAG: hypothetical protein A2135_02765 [Actinobacteria bacterium RBG_16_67_15]
MERASLLAGASSAPRDQVVAPLAIAPEPGRVLGLIGGPGTGLTRLALSLLGASPGMVAVVDVRGWLCPVAAWEAGIAPERLVVVRCPERREWSQVTASLIEGFPLVYAEVPAHPADADLRRLGALARARNSALVLRPVSGDLPPGVLHLRLEAEAVTWEGVDRGHGSLLRRRLILRASGKGARGIEQFVEVEDDGSHALRVVPRLAAAPAGLAAG